MPLPPGGPMGGLHAAAPSPSDPGPDPSMGGPDLAGASDLLSQILQAPEIQASPDLQDALSQILSMIGGPPPGPGPTQGPGGPPPPGAAPPF